MQDSHCFVNAEQQTVFSNFSKLSKGAENPENV
jgi:hypothetical protein